MQKLAESFALNSDILLRHRVFELYSSGLDGLAEEVPWIVSIVCTFVVVI